MVSDDHIFAVALGGVIPWDPDWLKLTGVNWLRFDCGRALPASGKMPTAGVLHVQKIDDDLGRYVG
jgi:hypothetical protein